MTLKLYEIHISESITKVLLGKSHHTYLRTVSGSFCATTAQSSRCNTAGMANKA